MVVKIITVTTNKMQHMHILCAVDLYIEPTQDTQRHKYGVELREREKKKAMWICLD